MRWVRLVAAGASASAPFLVGTACGAASPAAKGGPIDAGMESRAVQGTAESEGDGPVTDLDMNIDANTDIEAGAAVSGAVVDFVTLRPLSGRSVSIGGGRATTDANGQFSVTGAPPVYDAMVWDADGTTVSVYRTLTARTVLLPHKTLPGATANKTVVTGTVSGGGSYPLAEADSVDVYFFSDQTDNEFSIGYGHPAGYNGPGYGPMILDWDGPGSISGRLMAFGSFAADGGISSWFSDQPLTVTGGEMAVMDVPLAPIMQSGHVSGLIQTPPKAAVASQEAFYRLPIAHATVTIPSTQTSSSSIDDTVPDLTALGGQLCIGATSTQGASTQRCGLSLGETNALLTIGAPPSLLAPASGATITKDTNFSWTPFVNGVYVLELESLVPTSLLPRIYLYTSSTGAIWPDLGAIGVSFPASAQYDITLVGLGPYANIDAALGLDGLGAPMPVELDRGDSAILYATTGAAP